MYMELLCHTLYLFNRDRYVQFRACTCNSISRDYKQFHRNSPHTWKHWCNICTCLHDKGRGSSCTDGTQMNNHIKAKSISQRFKNKKKIVESMGTFSRSSTFLWSFFFFIFISNFESNPFVSVYAINLTATKLRKHYSVCLSILL